MSQNQLTLFVEDFPVKTSRLQEIAQGLLEAGADYGLNLRELLTNLSQSGLLGKTSPAFYPATKDETLPSSFDGWQNAGMAWHGGCLTLSISESPKNAAGCSLSQVLEVEVPQEFYLTKATKARYQRFYPKRIPRLFL